MSGRQIHHRAAAITRHANTVWNSPSRSVIQKQKPAFINSCPHKQDRTAQHDQRSFTAACARRQLRGGSSWIQKQQQPAELLWLRSSQEGGGGAIHHHFISSSSIQFKSRWTIMKLDFNSFFCFALFIYRVWCTLRGTGTCLLRVSTSSHCPILQFPFDSLTKICPLTFIYM